MGLDTFVVLALTLSAVVFFVWIELNSRRNARNAAKNASQPGDTLAVADKPAQDRPA